MWDTRDSPLVVLTELMRTVHLENLKEHAGNIKRGMKLYNMRANFDIGQRYSLKIIASIINLETFYFGMEMFQFGYKEFNVKMIVPITNRTIINFYFKL